MTVRSEIKNKPYGETMIAILEDQGIIDLIDGNISDYFRAYRSISPDIFYGMFKEMYLKDERVHAIMARDKIKEKATALTMTDLYYILSSVTGMCNQTIKRRVENTPGIIRVKGRHEYYLMVRPDFTDEELKMMKHKISEAKININITDVGDYDTDDMQVVMNETRCDSEIPD